MNRLKAEIDRKRKAAVLATSKDVSASEEPANKIVKLSEPISSLPSPSSESKDSKFNVSEQDCIKRLRSKGQPIRLFGESDKEQRMRLRALELIENHSQASQGQRGNDLMRALESMEADQGAVLEELARKGQVDSDVVRKIKQDAGLPVDKDAASGEALSDKASQKPEGDTIVDLSLIKKNPHKLYPQIYFAIKNTVKDWEQYMQDRPSDVKQSREGKLAAATQIQTAEYLKPLLKSLRNRALEADVLASIAEITHNMQTREYIKANDAYLQLSIGNAPWPIGVTSVGIHERSARERIHNNQIAHVLNSETSRKYIQSLKRLITFSQTIRPPADLSQLMG